MGTAIGIPTTRVSNLFVSQRLTSQIQSAQLELFTIQEQLSTGHRFQLPSEDPNAAQRVVGLQRLLERKAQVKDNLTTVQSFYSATDSTLGSIADALSSIRGVALGAVGDTVDQQQRDAAAQQVQETIRQLVEAGNQEYRGRYLFAGARADVRPFEDDGAGVRYYGDDGHLSSYADVDMLVDTNLTGDQVFGATSAQVQGKAALEPVLSGDTRLADLNGGQGVARGKIEISVTVGTDTATDTIDLGHAETLGDVARLIHVAPHVGSLLNVDVAPHGLNISMAAGLGTIKVRDLGNTTASDLGILTPTGAADITGTDLNPKLQLTTPLNDILGVRSRFVARSAGTDNDILFQATQVGFQFDNVQIAMVGDSASGVQVDVPTDIDLNGGTVTIHFQTQHSTASDVITAFNTAMEPHNIQAAIDPTDDMAGGQGFVGPVAVHALEGGYGTPLDQASGLQIVNGGKTTDVTFADAHTIQDLLNTLNRSGTDVVAAINAAGDGIDIRSRLSGADFAIGENNGNTATDLGVRSFDDQTWLSELNYGAGVTLHTDPEQVNLPAFRITTVDGTNLDIVINREQTVGGVMQQIRDAAAQAGVLTLQVTAASAGNGIVLSDSGAPLNGEPPTLTVTCLNQSPAAVELGLVERGQTESTSPPGIDPPTIAGRDVNPLETSGAFNALVRLQKALEGNDTTGIERAMALLDDSTAQVNFVRAGLGARAQGLDVIQSRQSDENIQLQQNLSDEYDVDFTEAASKFTLLETAYQASLKTAGTVLQMTLLNYL